MKTEGKINKYHLLRELKERDGLTCGICGLSLQKDWEDLHRWLLAPRDKTAKLAGKVLRRTDCNITVDHKIPRGVLRRRPEFVYEKGWQWRDKDNLQLAHGTCNNEKADK